MSPEKLSQADHQILLELARQTILNYVQHRKVEKVKAANKNLEAPCGAFVTLHKQDMLRGCIGTFSSNRPLMQTIQEMAISSSQHDPRFPPVKESEMKDIEIEISVLSPLRQIQDISEIEVGRHGIYITQGFYSGVLLPQVATEQGWDRETFLEHTCLKAGLLKDAWKQKGIKIEVFEADVFGEKE